MIEPKPALRVRLILDNIISHKKEEVGHLKEKVPIDSLREQCRDCRDGRGFKNALSEPGRINIIAEIKKASPSAGVIAENFDPVEIAKIYQANGAAAISVLTDSMFFQGDIEFIPSVRESTTIPVLRKDFIIDPYQIYQSKAYKADAILLIAAVLTGQELSSYLALAESLDLDCLVEVHTEEELGKARACGASIIGINNRDLKTFKVDLATTLNLARKAGVSKILVSESGIRDFDDIRTLRDAGVNAFLIGEALMRAKDTGRKLRLLKGEIFED